jgi:glycerophosphoryl diester phosphodiesterase
MKTAIAALFLVCAGHSGPDSHVQMIAHRGGVVDAEHPEDSLSALQKAIQEGYWMVEVDIQASRDGELVVQHDDSLMRMYGVRKHVADLDWKDIRTFRSRIDGQPPCCFAEYAETCRGKIRLMIDGKMTGGQKGFFEKMEEILRANDLLKDALFIGSGEMKAYFKGKARIAMGHDDLKHAADSGEDVASLYFLFEHGNELDDASVKYAQSLHVPVVPTVNSYHYLFKRRDSTPESDIERLRRAGVTLFQIDSAFSGYCK